MSNHRYGPVPAAERSAYRATMKGWALIYAAPMVWAGEHLHLSAPIVLLAMGVAGVVLGMVRYWRGLRTGEIQETEGP